MGRTAGLQAFSSRAPFGPLWSCRMTTPSPSGAPDFKLKSDTVLSRLALHRVPQKYLLISAFYSYCILAMGYLQGTTIWVAFGLALFPWVIMVFFEVEWSYKHFGWFALFAFM